MLPTKDQRIINALREGSRIRLCDLSKKIDIPVSTLHDHIRKLKEQNKIRLVTLINYRGIRMPLQSWIFLEAQDREQTKQDLQNHPNINTLLQVNNGADFAIEGVFCGFGDYHSFLEELEQYGRVQDYPVVKEVSKETLRVAT